MSTTAFGIIAILVLLVFAWPRARAFFSQPSLLVLSIAFVVAILAVTVIIPETQRYGGELTNASTGDAG
ncbi:MAG: hypothetical protein WCL23_01175 [Candidatus Moraniibacteriota bacterium]